MDDHSPEMQWLSKWRIALLGFVGIPLFALTVFVVIEAVAEDRTLCIDPRIPFKCTNCGKKCSFSLGELKKMTQSPTTKPVAGPVRLTCPDCEKKTLTQAVRCLACKEIFVMEFDPTTGTYNDHCPDCGKSYSKLWNEKYRRYQKKPGIFKRIARALRRAIDSVR